MDTYVGTKRSRRGLDAAQRQFADWCESPGNAADDGDRERFAVRTALLLHGRRGRLRAAAGDSGRRHHGEGHAQRGLRGHDEQLGLRLRRGQQPGEQRDAVVVPELQRSSQRRDAGTFLRSRSGGEHPKPRSSRHHGDAGDRPVHGDDVLRGSHEGTNRIRPAAARARHQERRGEVRWARSDSGQRSRQQHLRFGWRSGAVRQQAAEPTARAGAWQRPRLHHVGVDRGPRPLPRLDHGLRRLDAQPDRSLVRDAKRFAGRHLDVRAGCRDRRVRKRLRHHGERDLHCKRQRQGLRRVHGEALTHAGHRHELVRSEQLGVPERRGPATSALRVRC